MQMINWYQLYFMFKIIFFIQSLDYQFELFIFYKQLPRDTQHLKLKNSKYQTYSINLQFMQSKKHERRLVNSQLDFSELSEISEEQYEDNSHKQLSDRSSQEYNKIKNLRLISYAQNQTQSISQISSDQCLKQCRRNISNKKNIKLNYNETDEINQELSQQEEKQYYYGGRVEKVFAERKKQGILDQIQRLCKISTCSYLHVQWLTDADLTQRNIKPTHRKITKIQQINPLQHFPSSYKSVQQIISATTMFPILYPKKRQQIQSRWQNMLCLILLKLLNFQQYHIAIGQNIEQVSLDYEQQLDGFNQIDKNEKIREFNLKFQHILSRIYFRKYNSWKIFWIDIGKSLSLLSQRSQTNSQIHDLQLISEILIFLYWQSYSIILFKQSKNSPLKFQFQKIGIQFIFKDNKLSPVSQADLIHQQIQFSTENPFTQIQNPPEFQSFSFNWLPSQIEKKKIRKEIRQGISYYTLKLQNLYRCSKAYDIRKISILRKLDPLYLVKWKDLPYTEATWEKQSDILASNGQHGKQKIIQFINSNKIPAKKTRSKLEQYYRYYHSIGIQDLKNPIEISKVFTPYSFDQPPIYKNYHVLKSFQIQSLNWLIKNLKHNRNCILGDQMGLGKTIQTISFLQHLFTHQNFLGPFLIIAPVSTIKQWKSQISSWTDFNVVMYKGNREERQFLNEYLLTYRFVNTQGWFVKKPIIYKFQILLTNYEMFVSQYEVMKEIPFQYIVVDQAHRVKNQNTKLSKTLKLLPCKRILLLTGTPFQNNPSQLWGLLNFIQPQKFHSFSSFKQKFGSLKTAEEVRRLQQILGPYLMRRVKSDVEKSIPKLSEILVTLELTRIQKTYYRGILQQNKNNLLHSLNKVQLNNVTMNLRKCCNHPYLISQQVREQIQGQNSVQNIENKFIQTSCKFQFLIKLLKPDTTTKTPKTLIFTQFLDSLALLCQFCQMFMITYQYLDGSVAFQQRQKRIDNFNQENQNQNQNIRVFIISTKAGGTGINLTAANCVVIFDSDWNPHNDIQAIARAHRIGQKKPVTVYRLIVGKTYEQVIYTSAVKKLGVGMAVLGDWTEKGQDSTIKQETPSSQQPYIKPRRGRKPKKSVLDVNKNICLKKASNKDQIQKLLKDGVLGFLKNQDKQIDNTIQNCTIQQLVANQGKVVEYETKDCAFLKTNFKHSDSKNQQNKQEQLNIDDKNFWEVALKNIQSPLQKFIKKYRLILNNNEQIAGINEQAEMMIECNEIVYRFLKSKIELKGYNVQQQKQLLKFLEFVFQLKFIVDEYHKVINYWIDEIEKPSRRYQKPKKQDILKIVKLHTPKPLPTEQKQQKKRQRKTQKQKQKKVTPAHKVQTQKVHKKQESISKIKQVKKSQNISFPQTTITYQPQSSEERIMFEQLEKERDKKLLQQLCSLCQLRRCSKFCSKLCKRYFHQDCYERFKSGKQKNHDQLSVQQQKWPEQKVLKSLNTNFQCFECSLGQIRCCICDNCDQAVPYIKKTKKKKQQEQNDQKNTDIDKIVQSYSQRIQTKVYGCHFPNCHKYFHLKCLAQMKNQLAFQIEQTAHHKQLYIKLKCPVHYCSKCHRKIMSAGLGCLRCPITYHQKCYNPKINTNINSQKFICNIHLSEQQKYIDQILEDQQSSLEQNITQKVQTKNRKQKQEKNHEKNLMKSQIISKKKQIKYQQQKNSGIVDRQVQKLLAISKKQKVHIVD